MDIIIGAGISGLSYAAFCGHFFPPHSQPSSSVQVQALSGKSLL